MSVDNWNNVRMRHSIAGVIQQGMNILGRYAQARREGCRRLRWHWRLRRCLRFETLLITREREATFPGRRVAGKWTA